MDYEILLVNASRDYSGFSEAFRDSIGQYMIASYLREHHFKAYVYSGNLKECKEVIEAEVGNGRTTIVGFYAAADNIRVVGHMVKWMKRQYPFCKTVIGGPQAIGLEYHFFEETGNDFAIIGEGEIPMYYLLSALIDETVELTKVPSLVMQDKVHSCLVVNHCEHAVIQELDTLDYPRREDSLTGRLRQGEVVGIITGRGCPYQCSFCYEGANAKNVRLRTISNVMEEIDYIRDHNKYLNFISIYDDTFTLKIDRVLEFCEQIRKRDLLWFCEGHISFVVRHEDILKRMIAAGLSCIQFGIESGSDVVLNAYNKRITSEMIIEAIEICKNAGIHSVTGNFIIGGALESRETIEASKKLAKELIHRAKGIIELYTVYFAPYPNTQMVRNPEKYGIEMQDELTDVCINTMRTPVVSTKELSRNEIYDLKHEFDEFIKSEYISAAKESRKRDICQGLFHQGKRISVNPTWERIYYSQPHISLFLEHLDELEQVFDENKYIIRTFEDVKMVDSQLVSEVGTFEGADSSILWYATGTYSARELAELLQLPIETIEQRYYELNDRCLVYMTEF